MQNEEFNAKEWDKLWKEIEQTEEPKSFQEMQNKVHKSKNFKTGDFGIGAAMMANYQDPLQGLQADIRAGTGHIEFAPSIQQGQGYHSFTKIGKEKRQAMKDLAKLNETTISTHAHAGVTGLSGFNEQNYSFNEQQRQHNVNEVKKAIDFAAEVANGGSITFHSGEFARPMAGRKWGGQSFEAYEGESEDTILAVYDKTNDQIVKESVVRPKDKVFASIPVGEVEIKDLGVKIPDYKMEGEEDNLSKQHAKSLQFKNFKEYAGWLYENNKNYKNIVDNKIIKKDNVDIFGKGFKADDNKKYKEITDYYALEQAAKHKFLEDKKGQLSMNYYQQMTRIARENTDFGKIKDAYDDAREKINKGKKIYFVEDTQGHRQLVYTEDEINRMKNSGNQREMDHAELIQNESQPIQNKEQLDNFRVNDFYQGYVNISEAKDRLKAAKANEATIKSQMKYEFSKLEENEKAQNQMATISEYAKEKTEKSFASLGKELYHKNQAMKKNNKEAKDMYFAIENLFPEKYGAHPDELLDVIDDARKSMKKALVNENVDKKEADKIAKKSIKATFDTGHLHMWKKYFKRKEGESEKKFDERFNKWAKKQTKKLIDKGVIGNIHLADNFGYDDDHVTPGQGNVPLKDYMKMFDEAKEKGKITGKIAVEGFEEGGGSHGVHEAWKSSGVQVFRGQVATDAWVNPESSAGSSYTFGDRHDMYHTNIYKPSFVFGKYSPDQEEWGPWSETSLE
ncbi:MAG: hypothetical protein ACQER9_02165 [Nanobdellota archaeon]